MAGRFQRSSRLNALGQVSKHSDVEMVWAALLKRESRARPEAESG